MSAKSVLHPLELMTVLIIYGIDNKVRVYMPLVYMRGYQNFMPFPCLLQSRYPKCNDQRSEDTEQEAQKRNIP